MFRFFTRLARALRRPDSVALRRADEQMVHAELEAIEAAMWLEQARELRRRAEGR
ncbi:hypothetical protein [Amycolatopsis sp. NBC_00438]|uniref:hypothetical protein n=1 Tax=Amycolatopsis sp. NBC_00438 TaxID=2903558 RepID=UPI002E1FEE80